MVPLPVTSLKGLSFLNNKTFFTEYPEEIIECFFIREKENKKIKKRSDQLQIRPALINLIHVFAKHQDYSQSTILLGKKKNKQTTCSGWFMDLFSGIYTLDLYMDLYILSDNPEHQKLIALVALLLAAKSEDLDVNVPSIKDILYIVDLSNDLNVDLRFKDELDPKLAAAAYKNFLFMYCKLEFLIFECMDFNLNRPTVATFVNVFRNIVVTEADATDIKRSLGDDAVMLGDLEVQANQYIHEFYSVIVKDIDFFNETPSEVAASIIAATRKLLKIKNYWNEDLVQLTRYKLEDIRLMTIMLMEKRIDAVYERSTSVESDVAMKDSGYVGSPESTTEISDDEEIALKRRKLSYQQIAKEIA
jgi:hypothetical protein